ncbi:MAG TPA: hypothetical protein IAA29_04845 [Candidatus Paenibacillus intestinavium]|nr:hypothetical protein [Candidatus Paenibacillus intestinavium]
MKSKRAMIERRNTERRRRREQKKNPPSLFSKLFDRILSFGQVLFIISLFAAVISPLLIDLLPGARERDADLIPFTAERIATFLLFGILVIGSIVGTVLLFKGTNDSRREARKEPVGLRVKIMKIALLLFFALVCIVSAIICWAQLKALAEVLRVILF